ncbi:hypothetical protein EDD15DRAFT_1812652 [Pisolithus albus]|nr:hypothetical protein EDD15DRAFT_1812652 [Pisolithus albus]
MPFEGDPLAFYGKNIIEDYHASLMAKLEPETPELEERDYLMISDEKLRFLPEKKVVILGAGAAGLYTALILDSLNIEFEILEASDHVGGRLSTYKFPNGERYDYYDPGAMRYPLPKKEQGQYKNGIMKRLANLIVYLGLENSLIPYYYKAREGEGRNPGFYYFNGVRKPVSEDLKEDFRAEEIGVHADYIKAGAGTITKDVINPFVRVLADDLKHGSKRGWQMMKENDSYSVRAYMASKYLPSANLELPPRHLPNDVINWCSLLGGSSGGYDRALTESVLSALAFAKVGDTDFGKVEWKCFDDGSNVVPQRMAERIDERERGRIHFGKRVHAISHGHDLVITVPSDYPTGELPEGATEVVEGDRKTITVPGAGVAVRVTSESNPRVYSHVISTLPLPVLRTIDIEDDAMSVRQKNALRQLQYGPSIKIAIHFREPWWTTELGIVGGQSFTDLPIRTIVYPSYGVDSDTPSTVLIASYCWTTDADRLGSLAMPEQNKALETLVLRNLAEAHGNPITYEFLLNQFRGMHVKDWNRDANAMGAFPYFCPGDFQNLYTSLTYPAAKGRLHFAGDAISVRHAWVVGALDSAWRAVYEYLEVTEQDKERFFYMWGRNAEWTSRRGGETIDDEEPDLLRKHLGLVHEFSNAGQL